ncbi:MAG: hypothetical protein QNJ92_09325, partial [Alphaproteobacteria bacterium]|nr:hypothetical protein [Alphaproteobacteria bacterium]
MMPGNGKLRGGELCANTEQTGTFLTTVRSYLAARKKNSGLRTDIIGLFSTLLLSVALIIGSVPSAQSQSRALKDAPAGTRSAGPSAEAGGEKPAATPAAGPRTTGSVSLSPGQRWNQRFEDLVAGIKAGTKTARDANELYTDLTQVLQSRRHRLEMALDQAKASGIALEESTGGGTTIITLAP